MRNPPRTSSSRSGAPAPESIHYPRLVEQYYKLVWATVDKQIFLDKGLD